MKNEEKKEKKKYQKQKINTEIKKPSRKETTQEEKTTKNIKGITSKNNIPNIYKLTTGANLFLNSNKNEKNEASNSFEGKMFYEVNNINNNKNSYNLNSPIKTINVYRNNIFNYTNNNILSNLLCDVSDDNKNVMVSELDLNITNSQAPTPRQINEPPPQKRFLEKQNTEIDFKSQLESNIIKILEKNLVTNNENNNNKNKSDKKRINQKITEENKDINLINLKQIETKKEVNKINQKNNLDNIKILENKKIKYYQNGNNKYLSKVNSLEIKNKYFLSSAKSRKSRYLKSPNNNIHKVNSVISPTNKLLGNKKIYLNNYTKTEIGNKKYKTIIENNNNTNNNYNLKKNINLKNNQINSVKFFNQIKSKNKKNKIQIQNSTSKKVIKSYIINNQNLASNKIINPNINNNNTNNNNNNYSHFIHKLNEKSKSKNILLTNNSNNNFDININSDSINKTDKMNYCKYKNLLNELQKNLSKHFQKKEENNSKANSHRNKKNQTYLIFNIDNINNGRKSIKKGEIFSSNTSNTISNKINLNSLNNINHMNKIENININNEEYKKNIIITGQNINSNLNKKINVKNISCLTKQNSDNNLLKNAEKLNKNHININNNESDISPIIYEQKIQNKNNSVQLNQKLDSILSDSLLNIYHKSNNEKNKFKYNNNLSLYGIEKINIEINQKSNNSNIEINPKDLLEEANKEKERGNRCSNKTLNNSQMKKKNSDLCNDNNIIIRKSKKLNIINKKLNASNNKYNNYNYHSNSKSNNINNMINNNMISFRNKFINNISIKNHLSISKDNKENKEQKIKNKINKNFFHNNNSNVNHFSPVSRIKAKKGKNLIKEGNKINIDINFNNNINYIYIIKTKKNGFKNKSNNHFSTMK